MSTATDGSARDIASTQDICDEERPARERDDLEQCHLRQSECVVGARHEDEGQDERLPMTSVASAFRA